jgi:hypothetical protein
VAPVRSTLAFIEKASDEIAPNTSFNLYRWDRFPKVIIFDFETLSYQDRMFTRLAYFLEKRWHRGALLSDKELQDKHGWTAHDYGPQGLASFFSKAASSGFPLDDEELLLRSILLREGVIEAKDHSYIPGEGAALSINRSSSYYERVLLLAHESYHGIYFCSAEYRKLCREVWASASPAERLFIIKLLSRLTYDTADRELLINEFQAYLLQQPRSYAPAYFKRAAKLIADEDGEPDIDAVLPDLLASEQKLEDYLMAHYAIRAGGGIVRSEAVN